MVIIVEKKVLTNNMAGRSIAAGLLVLVSTYYAHQLEFPKNVGTLTTFLARQMGNAPFERNPTTVYTNFMSSIELSRRIRRQMMTQLPDVLVMMSAAIVSPKS
ncbi:MAG: hypothetical protein MJE68_19935, partial [Proteobacteria bacterium]|nr:hypothetical protein [Pseudomonadota bacterium]